FDPIAGCNPRARPAYHVEYVAEALLFQQARGDAGSIPARTDHDYGEFMTNQLGMLLEPRQWSRESAGSVSALIFTGGSHIQQLEALPLDNPVIQLVDRHLRRSSQRQSRLVPSVNPAGKVSCPCIQTNSRQPRPRCIHP